MHTITSNLLDNREPFCVIRRECRGRPYTRYVLMSNP